MARHNKIQNSFELELLAVIVIVSILVLKVFDNISSRHYVNNSLNRSIIFMESPERNYVNSCNIHYIIITG